MKGKGEARTGGWGGGQREAEEEGREERIEMKIKSHLCLTYLVRHFLCIWPTNGFTKHEPTSLLPWTPRSAPDTTAPAVGTVPAQR